MANDTRPKPHLRLTVLDTLRLHFKDSLLLALPVMIVMRVAHLGSCQFSPCEKKLSLTPVPRDK